MGQLFGEGGKLDSSRGNKLLSHTLLILLMSLISILPVHIPDAHLTLSNSSSVNDLVVNQS